MAFRSSSCHGASAVCYQIPSLPPTTHHRYTKTHLLPTCTSKRISLKTRATSSNSESGSDMDCVGTGTDVECVVDSEGKQGDYGISSSLINLVWEWGLVVSPFFFWGTAMVAMKQVLPTTGPLFVSWFRLIPSGLLLVSFAASRGKNFPSGFNAWFSIALFALVDATCFQGFLAKGLEKTSAGLGSVIIDSQPLTVAVLASLLFGESIGIVGIAGLVLGVVGLALLELPAISFEENNISLWGSGECWMLLAAQSMAVGTVMVRWVSEYSDPVMATGWGYSQPFFPSSSITLKFPTGSHQLTTTPIWRPSPLRPPPPATQPPPATPSGHPNRRPHQFIDTENGIWIC